MKWIYGNPKKDIHEAKTNHMRLIVVKGHINYPNDWILNVYPDIFKGTYRLAPANEINAEQACKKAEQVTIERLNAMLNGVNA